MSSAGAVYHEGFSGARAEPFGYGLCLILTGLLIARPLWRLRLTTLADLFRLRFSPTVERVAVLLMVPTSLFWAAAQIRAFGQVLSSASGFDVEIAVLMAAAIVVLYTMVGGLLADAWTDLVQGAALLIGLAVLLVAVLRTEGLAPLTSVLQQPRPEAPLGLLGTVEEWAIPVVGSLVAAEVVARILAARSGRVAGGATTTAGVAYLVVGIGPIALGVMGASLLPGLADGEQILPALADRYLPTALAVLFSGALVSAILSTVDSALLVAAGLVSHNLIVPLFPAIDDATRVRLARGMVVLFGGVAYVMAAGADRIYDLVEQASAFGSAGIVVTVLFGLFTRLGGACSALAALLIGVAAWAWGAYVMEVPYPYLTSLAAASMGYLAFVPVGLKSVVPGRDRAVNESI